MVHGSTILLSCLDTSLAFGFDSWLTSLAVRVRALVEGHDLGPEAPGRVEGDALATAGGPGATAAQRFLCADTLFHQIF